MPSEEVNDFDFGAAKAGLPEEAIAPDGPYNLEIKKCEAKHSKGDAMKGKPARPMLVLTCHITSGPYAGLPVWHNLVYTEENPVAKRMFFAQLAMLGIPNPGRSGEMAAALKGRVFQAQVGHRVYNGLPSNTIEKIIGLVHSTPAGTPAPSIVPTGGVPAPMPATAPVIPDVATDVPPAVPPTAASDSVITEDNVPKPPF